MKLISLFSLILACACNSATAAITPQDFETLEQDTKFVGQLVELDFEAPGVLLEYNPGTTSVGIEVRKDDKQLGKWKPQNSATDVESQVVSYHIGRYLGMSRMVIPSAYYTMKTGAIAQFKTMLNKQAHKGQLQQNKVKTLNAIAKNPNTLEGVFTTKSRNKAEAVDVVKASANTLNSAHPLVGFIKASGAMPSAEKKMSLKGVVMKEKDEKGKEKVIGTPESTELKLARQLSQLMVLDILIGQWDRFSGGNLEATFDKKTGEVWFYARDNGGAGMNGTAQLKKYFGLVTRFDRAQIERVEQLLNELQADPAATATAIQLRSKPKSLIDRATALLNHVEAQIKAHGEAKVFFPAE